MLDDVTIVVWIDVPLSDTDCIQTTIDLLSSLNLIASLVKLRGIYNYNIHDIEDPNKYEILFEPEV